MTGAASLIYFLIRWSPTGWWLPAGLVFALLIVGLTNLAPVALLPLFYRMKPLDRESLRARLLNLAERAGARVLDAYEWGLSGKTKKANAALTGLGATRRILVSDTMLAEYWDEEIEIVLAHELAHHVHGDIWKGLAFESALLLAGFQIAARWPWAGRSSCSGFVVPPTWRRCRCWSLRQGPCPLVMVPIAHAMSRAYERRADRFALELTNNPFSLHFGDAAFERAEPRRGAPLEGDPVAVLQPPAHSRAHRGSAGIQGLNQGERRF